MRFRLTPRSMTLDDLELYKFEFSENFSGFRRFRTQQQHNRMKIDQYCQRQRCKHVNLVQFWHAFASRRFVSDSWAFLFSQSWMHCSSGLFGVEIGWRIPAAPWAPLAADPGSDPVPRLCVLVYRYLYSTAPTYLADSRRRTADVDGRRRLRSSVSDTLVVAPTNHPTLANCAFPVAVGMTCLPGTEPFIVTVDVLSGTEDLSLLDEFSVTYTSAGRSSFLDFWRCIQRACCIFCWQRRVFRDFLHSYVFFHLNIIKSLLTILLTDY